MKKSLPIIPALIILLLICSCSTRKLSNEGIYKELEPAQFENVLNQNDINIIDVRTKAEYNKSHLKGAVNASFLSGIFLKLIAQYHLDTNKTTLIYCETQHRSPVAAKRLYKIGFTKIIDLKKGMVVWRKQGYPYESTLLQTE